MKFKAAKLTAGLLAAAVAVSFVGCGGKGGPAKTFDNENDPVVFSTLEVDKVFNPFFYTTGPDGTITGLTQLSMLSSDEDGNVAYGEDEACIVLDYEEKTTGEGEAQRTEYKFVLKNNIRFSDGVYLSMKDVLFNFYVYLDPVYTGSSTIYSTDIVGLQEYRTQEADEYEQDAFMQQFENAARSRIDNLSTAAYDILREAGTAGLDLTTFRTKLQEYQDSKGEAYKNIVNDFNLVADTNGRNGVSFREELETDWSNSLNSYDTMVFQDEKKEEYKGLFTTDVEVFLYNEGYITWNRKEAKLESSLTNNVAELKKYTKERAINLVYNDKIPNAIEEVLTYWVTGSKLFTYLTNEEFAKYNETHEVTYPNISGIKFANRTQPVTVNGKEYGVPVYADGSNNTQVISGNEVLSITIKKVDPKAIWNFGLPIAPMHYYSDAEHVAAFDYERNFGVERGSQDFYNNVVKASNKIGVPVGAGPYAASKSSGGISGISAGDFYQNGVIYFERNPYFLMTGTPLIKKLRYQVVSSQNMLNALYNGEMDFVEPNAKPETIDELNGKRKDGIGNQSITTMGYGYIGVNAARVPALGVRQAIMHSINILECVEYYGTEATPLYRSMSSESWAYPENATSYYPYIAGPVPANLDVVNPAYARYVRGLGKKAGDVLTQVEQDAFIQQLVEDAGYTVNASGVYTNGSNTLKIDFVVAGEETDHPAWAAFRHAQEVLNRNHFNITVKTDAQALSKLSTGALSVWAAAWSSTIDPDMYQVYHKESKATSTLNWGYNAIKQNNGGKYNVEYGLLNDLSDLIDKARETTVQSTRKQLYSQALDIVMQMAVELPTYQRKDLFAYNANKIDEATFTPKDERTAFKGLVADIHKLSLIIEK